MNVGITINEIVRDFLFQFGHVYTTTYYREENPNAITSLKLWEFYDFQNIESPDHNTIEIVDEIEEYTNFIENEAALDIYGFAPEMYKGAINDLNHLFQLISEKGHTLTLIDKAIDNQLAGTLFFLSKNSFKGNRIRFVSNFESVLQEMDLFITAEPDLLSLVPEKTVKINCSYNHTNSVKHSYDSLSGLIQDISTWL